jgi:hypothetical protein
MNKFLLFCFCSFCAVITQAQSTYYWVGGAPVAPQNISTLSNWNTSPDGTGSSRGSSTGADILVFDGANYGGSTPTTGTDSVYLNSSISCAQIKFVNGAKIIFKRNTMGTSTLTIIGDGTTAEDFLIEAGCSVKLSDGPGSQIIAIGAANTGRVSGDFTMSTSLQAGIRNTTAGNPGSLIFTSGANFYSNITATPSFAYPFGNATQSSERWVVFEAGANLYYDGGSSPFGSVNANQPPFQPIEFRPGSNFYVRTSNLATAAGVFTNRKAFANIILQNGATLTADGSINRIDTLIINSGSTFIVHSSGQTVVLGDLNVFGSLGAASTSTNEIVFAGNTPQSISGTGSVTIPSLMITDGAAVTLNKNVAVNRAVTINGKIDFETFQITGDASFNAKSAMTSVSGTANRAAGAYLLTGVSGASGLARGINISGTGLQPGTRVVSYTTNADSIYISRPALSTGAGTAVTFSADEATLETNNPAGFDPANGSVAVTADHTYGRINYIINTATVKPFGLDANGTETVEVASVSFNAPVTTNATAIIYKNLQATSGKVTIRPTDSLWLMAGANLSGSYNNTTYFVTDVNSVGETGVFRKDGVIGSTLFPIGNATHYLPVSLNPATTSDFATNVFQGITENGTPNGTPLSTLQKQTVVDAVWNIQRVNGTGDANLQLQWTPVLEGTTLATFANSEIGIIKNTGSGWSLPFGTGDNAANIADTTFSSFGQFSVGARPPANPFLFNPLPTKNYGDPDFSPGVISSNTTQPINYSSSNTAVATIVGGMIHITGTGTTIITATQATDGFYPAANVLQSLTVEKAALTIKADRKTKPEGDPNPPLTATYTGFVLGETPAVLLTPAVLTTTATTSSAPGSYVINVSGATAANYNITFENDSLIVRPRTLQTITFDAITTRTYGAADFAIGASSTNASIPITYTSSNPAVAAIVGSNIHIVGAGTTTITASQAGSDLYFPAAPLSQTLTVNRAPLTIRVFDTTKVYGQPNPSFRMTMTGFVLGQNSSVLTAQPTIHTTASTNSAPGYYTLEPTGAAAANYNIIYVSGRLTILPATGTDQGNLQAFMTNSNTLAVRVYSPEPDLGDVYIYDINGRPITKKNIFIAQGFITTHITISGLPSGIYVVQVVGMKTKLKITVPILH